MELLFQCLLDPLFSFWSTFKLDAFKYIVLHSYGWNRKKEIYFCDTFVYDRPVIIVCNVELEAASAIIEGNPSPWTRRNRPAVQ